MVTGKVKSNLEKRHEEHVKCMEKKNDDQEKEIGRLSAELLKAKLSLQEKEAAWAQILKDKEYKHKDEMLSV